MSTETYRGCTFRYVHDTENAGKIRVYLENAPDHRSLISQAAAFGLQRMNGAAPPFLSFSDAEKPASLGDAKRRAHAWADTHLGASRLTASPEPRQRHLHPAALTDLSKVTASASRQSSLSSEALRGELSTRIRGQDHAIAVMADEVARHASKPYPRRPLSLFLTGPTGVGKTLSVRSLADALSRNDSGGYGWLRLDMCEYQESYRISQLLGAPQGYVGHGDGAQLSDALRSNPRTVVLFDEIEKAHPDIFRTLMNAMDAGRLSVPAARDGNREIDCRQAIFCFTSNIDATGIVEDLRRRNALDNPRIVDDVCRNRLRAKGIPAELIGRITRFMPFMPIDTGVRGEVIALGIRELGTEYGLNVVHIAPEAITLVMAEARGSAFGVRPDEYVVDQLLGSAFMAALTAGVSGDVTVGCTNGVVDVTASRPAAEQ